MEEELSDTISQMEDLTRRCHEAENEKNMLLREKANIQMQFEEGEENLAEVFTMHILHECKLYYKILVPSGYEEIQGSG